MSAYLASARQLLIDLEKYANRSNDAIDCTYVVIMPKGDFIDKVQLAIALIEQAAAEAGIELPEPVESFVVDCHDPEEEIRPQDLETP